MVVWVIFKHRKQPQPVTSVKFTTDTYVEITVPGAYGNEDKLKQAIFVRGFPIPPPALVFAQQMKRAVMICGTKEGITIDVPTTFI